MKEKTSFRRVIALIGVIILAGLYIASLIIAIFCSKHAVTALKISIFSTIVVPAWIYVMLMFYKLAHKKDKSDDMVFSDDEDDHYNKQDCNSKPE